MNTVVLVSAIVSPWTTRATAGIPLLLASISDWIEQNPVLVKWTVASSAVLFLISLIGLPLVVISLRSDFFVRRRRKRESASRSKRIAVKVVRNLVGIFFIVAGIAMLILPGPGLVALLIGVSLIDMKRKRALQLRILRNRRVIGTINWIRAKAGRDPLQVPNDA